MCWLQQRIGEIDWGRGYRVGGSTARGKKFRFTPPPPARELHGKGTMRCEGGEMKDASLNLPSKS